MKTKLKRVTEAFPGSSNTSIEEWDIYLSELEFPCREVLLKPNHYDYLAEKETIKCTYENLECRESQYDLFKKVESAMLVLTEREKQAIEMLYWKNFRKSEVAKKMNVSRQTIQKLEERALEKLKEVLSEKDERSLVFTMVRGTAG